MVADLYTARCNQNSEMGVQKIAAFATYGFLMGHPVLLQVQIILI